MGAHPSFRYADLKGTTIDDEATLERIRRLAIPPAWTDVWICGDPDGHLQACGRDARGRKQYRYHPRWRAMRDETKYHRMLAFGEVLPRIRAAVDADLRLAGLPRRKVLALVVTLLETTFIRVGNEEYARQNQSFGLTTMQDDHVKISGGRLRFKFRGKSGKDHEVELHDARLARLVRQCRDVPGYDLFQYYDEDGQPHDVESSDVNEYLREVTGEEFTAKDFRTWAGTVLASLALSEFEKFDSQAERKRHLVAAIKSVSQRLGNTPAVCRKCYIHPAVIDSYLEGTMLEALKARTEREIRENLTKLKPEEAAVLGLLQQRLAAEKERDERRDRQAVA